MPRRRLALACLPLPLLMAMTQPFDDDGKPVVAVQPVGNPAEWITPDDYPIDALSKGQEGSVEIRFTIETDGLVRNCRVTQSSGVASLDETSCAVIKMRARFSPARDAKGNPVPWEMRRRITWRIPAASSRAPLEFMPVGGNRVLVHISIDAAGRFTGCDVSGDVSSADDVEKLCASAPGEVAMAGLGEPLERFSAIDLLYRQAIDDQPMPAGLKPGDYSDIISIGDDLYYWAPDGTMAHCRASDAVIQPGAVPCAGKWQKIPLWGPPPEGWAERILRMWLDVGLVRRPVDRAP